jgi:hypothetical protein
MPELKTHPVQIRSRNQHELPETVGSLTEIQWNRKDQIKNAIRTFFMWIGIMCGSALVPFWHYLLVPGFFILAWVMAMDKLSEKNRSGGGEGTCPHCAKPFKIGKSAWKSRMTDTCEGCFQELELIPRIADQ